MLSVATATYCIVTADDMKQFDLMSLQFPFLLHKKDLTGSSSLDLPVFFIPGETEFFQSQCVFHYSTLRTQIYDSHVLDAAVAVQMERIM